MDYSTNISPGVIESYCLGLLSPEENAAIEQQAISNEAINQEIEDFINTLEKYALANGVAPAPLLRTQIFESLLNLELEEAKDIARLPLINKHTDYTNWLSIVKPLLPEKEPRGLFVKELRNDGNVSQLLFWTAIDYPDEVHTDEEECFIVLKGRCRCHIDENVIELGPGDFLEIPLHSHHNVEVLEPVIAIVQRKKVA